jgi:hypothetical protein
MAKIEIEFGANFEKYMKDFSTAQQKTESGISSIQKTFSTIAGLSVFGYGTSQLFDLGTQLVKSAAELDVLRSSFRGTASDMQLFEKATAGTVTEANLLKMSNQATDLGLSMEQQAILMSLAEDAADKYGGSVEDNFGRVLKASEGSTKGLKELGIQKAVYDQTVQKYVSGYGAQQLSQLDAETQKWIQVQAVIDAAGVSLDDVGNKMPDFADKIDQVTKRWEDFKTSVGSFITQTGRGAFFLISEIASGKSITEAIANLQAFETEAKAAKAMQQTINENDRPENKKPDGTFAKGGKSGFESDESLKNKLAHIEAQLKINKEGRTHNELLKQQQELEDKLYGFDRAINMTDAARAASSDVDKMKQGITTIPIDKNSFNDKFFTSKVQSENMPNVDSSLLEIDDTWKQIGESAADATNMMASGLARAITKGENLGETLKNIGSSFLESGLAMLFSIGMKAGLTAMGVPAYLFANGGVIAEPVVGMGLNSRKSYMFGEAGNEIVIPASRYQSGGGAPAQNINIQVGGTLTANGTELHAVLKRIDKLEKRYK